MEKQKAAPVAWTAAGAVDYLLDDQSGAGHLVGFLQAHHIQNGGGDVGQLAALTQLGTGTAEDEGHQILGVGAVGLAVLGIQVAVYTLVMFVVFVNLYCK